MTFSELLEAINKLPEEERKALFEASFQSETTETKTLKEDGFLKKNNGEIISCPHCGSTNIVTHGSKDGKRRYRCKEESCRKTFMEKTGTFFFKSRLSEAEWRELLRGMVENQSDTRIANNLGLSPKAIRTNKNKVMEMIARIDGGQDYFKAATQSDETFVHISYKGKRDPKFFIYHLRRMPRHHMSRAEKIEYLKKHGLWEELQQEPEFLEFLLTATKRSETSLPGTNEDSVCVLTAIDDDNNIYIYPVCLGSMESGHVSEHFEPHFSPKSILITDGNTTYNWFSEETNILHQVIPADKHRVGNFNLAGVNSLHSRIKAYYPKEKGNLPATKYLAIGLMFFRWLDKHKELTTDQKVNAIYDMMKQQNTSSTYEEMRHRKLSLDTKGLIPLEVFLH